ncbi:hypothetical protein ACLOAV_001253 [Pseudogymnoascus australis]
MKPQIPSSMVLLNVNWRHIAAHTSAITNPAAGKVSATKADLNAISVRYMALNNSLAQYHPATVAGKGFTDDTTSSSTRSEFTALSPPIPLGHQIPIQMICLRVMERPQVLHMRRNLTM